MKFKQIKIKTKTKTEIQLTTSAPELVTMAIAFPMLQVSNAQPYIDS